MTPVLFTVTADRLWFALARTTVKARVLNKRAGVGVLLDDGASALAISGAATVLDPRRPGGFAERFSELVRAPLAVPTYGLRNPAELLGFARDAMLAPARAAPPNLVLVSVEADRIEPLPSDSRKQREAANARREALTGSGPRGRWREWLAGIPEQAAVLARVPGPAVLGWLTPAGPLALPATWDPRHLRARAPWSPLASADAGREGPACLCLDITRGRGPAAKEGLLLRGSGRLTQRGDVASVTLELERITYWSGFDVGTVAAADKRGA